MSMSVAPDEAIEFTTGSFYEVSQFKRTVARIDNGHKQCDELLSFIRERAAIEEQYCKMIKNWSAKYTKIIEKGSCYHTLQQSWLGMIKESERLADVHQHVGKDLLKEDLDKVKAWKKTHYHSLTLGGLKETKTCNDEFAKAQKPWAKLYKKVMDSKKLYYQSCKEERSAQMQENTAKSDSTLPPEKVKKLEELVEKKGADRRKQKDKYESALSELDSYNSKYMEDMEMVFDKCQEFEKGRLQHFKEMLHTVQDHLDFSKKSEMKEINDHMHQCLQRANDESDLEWWRMNHGPGMAMSWPMFEEYDAERIHMQRNISKRTGGKVSKHVAGVDGMAGAQFTQNNEYSSYSSQTSTNGGANQRPTSWSDDEQNNPFDDDVIEGEGVPVIALYDYVGAEEDELSFKAGEKLYKLEDEDEQGWCRGKTDQGVSGLYPANYVKPI